MSRLFVGKMELKKRIDALMQAEIDKNEVVGSELFIFHDFNLIYYGSFGRDSKDNDKKLQKDSIFRMFSMTKPVTSLAVMIAMEQGLFSRESRISEFIPSFKNMRVLAAKSDAKTVLSALEGKEAKNATENDNNENNETVPAEREITVADCLSMTAGLEYPNDQSKAGLILGEKLYWPLEAGYPENRMSTYELISKTAEYPLCDQPGAHWNYSLCADVLAAVVEKASGMRYSDYLDKYIFKPLGMTDTAFYVPAEKTDRLVTMHDRQGDDWVKWEGTFLGMEKKCYEDTSLNKLPEFESGGAGLLSTPIDYTRIVMLLAGKGELPAEYSPTGKAVRLLSEESWKKMTTPALNPEQQSTADWYSLEGYNYGNLMRIMEDPVKAGTPKVPCGEFGWDGWAGTYFSVDPVNNIALMYFINQTNGNREWQIKALKNVLYEELF